MAADPPPGDWARPVVHWELVARDPQRLAGFYEQLFHWNLDDVGFIVSVQPGLGGPEPGPGGHFIGAQPDQPTGVGLFVQVLDIPATLERVPGLGGTVAGAPFDVPNGPTICPILDPEGNRITLVQQ
jgi:predicted enzyme related to lactoylglutathione lyase